MAPLATHQTVYSSLVILGALKNYCLTFGILSFALLDFNRVLFAYVPRLKRHAPWTFLPAALIVACLVVVSSMTVLDEYIMEYAAHFMRTVRFALHPLASLITIFVLASLPHNTIWLLVAALVCLALGGISAFFVLNGDLLSAVVPAVVLFALGHSIVYLLPEGRVKASCRRLAHRINGHVTGPTRFTTFEAMAYTLASPGIVVCISLSIFLSAPDEPKVLGGALALMACVIIGSVYFYGLCTSSAEPTETLNVDTTNEVTAASFFDEFRSRTALEKRALLCFEQ